MTKSVSSLVLDNGPAYLLANATTQVICHGAPASYAAAVGANLLASIPLAPGDLVLAAGAPAGSRAITAPARTAVPVTTGGIADHSALVDDVNSRLLLTDEIEFPLAISTDAPVDIDELVYTILQPV